MMKRIVLLAFVFVIAFAIPCFADEAFDETVYGYTEEYMGDLKREVNEILEDANMSDKGDFDSIIKDVAKGDVGFDLKTSVNDVLSLFFNEVKTNLGVCGLVIAVAFVVGMCQALCSKEGSNAAKYVGIFIITGLIVEGFIRILSLVTGVFGNAFLFMDVLMPCFFTILTLTGHVGVSATLSPVMYSLMQLVAFSFRTILVPTITLMFFMAILSSMSGNMNFSRIYEFTKHILKWITGIIFTVFISVTGFYSAISSTVEGLAGRALKQTVSGIVPVVGAMIADTTDLVVGALTIIKSGVGIIGMIVVCIICIVPIIKIFAVNIVYRFCASVIEPITDKAVVDMIWSAAETFNYFTATLAGLMVMLMISLALIINAATTSVMLR